MCNSTQLNGAMCFGSRTRSTLIDRDSDQLKRGKGTQDGSVAAAVISSCEKEQLVRRGLPGVNRPRPQARALAAKHKLSQTSII